MLGIKYYADKCQQGFKVGSDVVIAALTSASKSRVQTPRTGLDIQLLLRSIVLQEHNTPPTLVRYWAREAAPDHTLVPGEWTKVDNNTWESPAQYSQNQLARRDILVDDPTLQTETTDSTRWVLFIRNGTIPVGHPRETHRLWMLNPLGDGTYDVLHYEQCNVRMVINKFRNDPETLLNLLTKEITTTPRGLVYLWGRGVTHKESPSFSKEQLDVLRTVGKGHISVVFHSEYETPSPGVVVPVSYWDTQLYPDLSSRTLECDPDDDPTVTRVPVSGGMSITKKMYRLDDPSKNAHTANKPWLVMSRDGLRECSGVSNTRMLYMITSAGGREKVHMLGHMTVADLFKHPLLNYQLDVLATLLVDKQTPWRNHCRFVWKNHPFDIRPDPISMVYVTYFINGV